MTVSELKEKISPAENSAVVIIDCMGMRYDVEKVSIENTMLNKQVIVLKGVFN